MASRATVVGSSAYELERIGAIPEIPFERPGHIPREHVPVRPEIEERVKDRAKARAMAKAKQGQYVSAFAVIGTVCVCILLVLVLISYIQLSVITDEMAGMENELSLVQEEAELLEIKYERAFNLNDVEDYARNVLGMTEPAKGQTYYLENSLGDEATVLDQGALKEYGILGSITSFFSSIVE